MNVAVIILFRDFQREDFKVLLNTNNVKLSGGGRTETHSQLQRANQVNQFGCACAIDRVTSCIRCTSIPDADTLTADVLIITFSCLLVRWSSLSLFYIME